MSIRVLISCVFICNSVLSLFAQNNSDRYHEFGSRKRMHLNAYIGPLAAFSSVEGNFSFDMGATAGFIVNANLFAGLYGQKLLNHPPRTDLTTIGFPSYTDGEIGMAHAGGVLGYIHKPGKVLHWGISSSAGIGVLNLYAKNPVTLNLEKIYDDRVYIVIPRLFAEVNLTKWFKVNASAGYRFLGKVNGIYINQDHEEIMVFDKAEYTKPEFSITLLFGSFGIRKGILD